MCECKGSYMGKDGLCKFKFLGGNNIYCLCKDPDKLKIFRCVAENNQLMLVDRRWNKIQKRG